MKLARPAQKQLEALIADAKPLRGDFFRSVAFRYFHPDAAISGEGTRLAGGRFVPVGVNAVYATFDEDTTLREVTARKKGIAWPRPDRHWRISSPHVRHHCAHATVYRSCCGAALSAGGGSESVPAQPSIFDFAGIGGDLDRRRYRQRRISIGDGSRTQSRDLPGERRRQERHTSEPG